MIHPFSLAAGKKSQFESSGATYMRVRFCTFPFLLKFGKSESYVPDMGEELEYSQGFGKIIIENPHPARLLRVELIVSKFPIRSVWANPPTQLFGTGDGQTIATGATEALNEFIAEADGFRLKQVIVSNTNATALELHVGGRDHYSLGAVPIYQGESKTFEANGTLFLSNDSGGTVTYELGMVYFIPPAMFPLQNYL